MRLLVITMLLISAYSIEVGGKYDFSLNFQISGGGNGNIDIIEYPGNYFGQTSTCSSTKVNFPPYEQSISCQIDRFIGRDMKFDTYKTSNLTEVDSDMKTLANSLVKNEESRFDKAIALAGWIRKNVPYDLGVGDTQETAEWTYYHKVGTCDELSHLFIALARAVGLNVRYSAGYAYDGKKWLPHAWAEVWTKYGWTPIDVAFDEYGYVDSSHITVNKGADGDHNFIAINYFGKAVVSHDFSMTSLSSSNVDFVEKIKASNVSGNGYTLINITFFNPFETPIAFFPKLLPPQNFNIIPAYPKSAIILPPGHSNSLLAYHVQKVRQNYIYSIPLSIYFGPDLAETTFTVSNNIECQEKKEVAPYTYDTEGCTDLNSGRFANKTSSKGDFFCGQCFYSFEAPKSRTYKLDYPEFCEEDCTLKLLIIGEGPYTVTSGGKSYIGLVDVYKTILIPLSVGKNTVTIDGVERTLKISKPPELELSKNVQDGEVCFDSNWQLSSDCLPLSCGNNTLNLKARYDSASRNLNFEVTRDCGVFEKLIEWVRGLDILK